MTTTTQMTSMMIRQGKMIRYDWIIRTATLIKWWSPPPRWPKGDEQVASIILQWESVWPSCGQWLGKLCGRKDQPAENTSPALTQCNLCERRQLFEKLCLFCESSRKKSHISFIGPFDKSNDPSKSWTWTSSPASIFAALVFLKTGKSKKVVKLEYFPPFCGFLVITPSLTKI